MCDVFDRKNSWDDIRRIQIESFHPHRTSSQQGVALPSNLLWKTCNRTTQTICLLQRDVRKTDKYPWQKKIWSRRCYWICEVELWLKEAHLKVELVQGSGNNADQWYVNTEKKKEKYTL